MSSAKPSLSISFHNFWRSFDPAGSFFVRALSDVFDVTIAQSGRDVQICSVFGSELLPDLPAGKRALRVWYSGEARDPQSQLFDLYFGFRPACPLLGKRWHRLPVWVIGLDWWDPASPFHFSKLLERRPGGGRPNFCNFIYSAPATIRSEFFLRLNEARRVDSLGRILNNHGGERPRGATGKKRVLADSTFTIAFENQVAPGYVTEKLVEPLLAGSIPIYWGAEEAKSDFNPDAFIFAEDYGTFDDLVAHILRTADSTEAIAALTSAPAFRDNRIPYEKRPEYFTDRIRDALSGGPDAIVPRAMLAQQFDPLGERTLKRRLRRIRGRLRKIRLPAR